MAQTPVHDNHNPDLLAAIPAHAQRVIEVGSSSGALAKALKAKRPQVHYVGVEIDAAYVALSERYCDQAWLQDIEHAGADFWQRSQDRDCWVFGDTLEHMREPWDVLRKVRAAMPASGTVVACIPNVQHWSMQVRISVGDFRYQDSGLLDKTHVRWFTRQTMIELLQGAGFVVQSVKPRVFNHPNRDKFLPIIEQMATLAGADGKAAVQDALALQYVLTAVPKAFV